MDHEKERQNWNSPLPHPPFHPDSFTALPTPLPCQPWKIQGWWGLGDYVQPIQLYHLTCAPCSSVGYLQGPQFFRMILLQIGLPYKLQGKNCSTLVSMGCRDCPSTWVSLSPSLNFVFMGLFLSFFPHTPHCLFSFQSSWFSQSCHQFGWWMQWTLSGVSCIQHEVAMAPLHQGHPAVPALPAGAICISLPLNMQMPQSSLLSCSILFCFSLIFKIFLFLCGNDQTEWICQKPGTGTYWVVSGRL